MVCSSIESINGCIKCICGVMSSSTLGFNGCNSCFCATISSTKTKSFESWTWLLIYSSLKIVFLALKCLDNDPQGTINTAFGSKICV